jgi:hypothetical protein
MPLHVPGVTRPSSGGAAQLLFGVITCVGCVLTVREAVEPQPARSYVSWLHQDWSETPILVQLTDKHARGIPSAVV